MIRFANYMIKRFTKWALYAELHKVKPEMAWNDYWLHDWKKPWCYGWFNGACDPLALGQTRTRVGAWIMIARHYQDITNEKRG